VVFRGHLFVQDSEGAFSVIKSSFHLLLWM